MITIYPPYYKNFKCIADKCPDTCCAGWEVVVDEEFKSLCQNSSTPAAIKALDKMYTDSDGDLCLRLTKGRCPMLNNNNLCEVYIDMGKEALCNTCKNFPRFFKETEEYTLAGISVSCPEAARIILNDNSEKKIANLDFLENSDEKLFFEIYNLLTNIVSEGKFFNCDFEKLEFISDELLFNRLKFKSEMIFECFGNSTTEYSFDFVKSLADVMGEFEYLSNELPEILSKIKVCENIEHCTETAERISAVMNSKEIKNLIIYYLYKYLWEAISENNIDLWIKRAYTMAKLVGEICCFDSSKSQTRLSQLVSKEIEHNADNLEAFDEFCITNIM